MAKLLQLRRGTTEEHIGSAAAGTGGSIQPFTGEVGEVTVDTDKDVLVVHDNSTPGGHVMLGETQAKTFGALFSTTQSTASLTLNLSNGSNQKITLPAGGVSSVNVSNATEGQSGSIFFVHTGTAGISGFSAAKFLFTKASGAPTSSLTSGSVDRLDYIVYVDTSGSEKLHCVFNVGVA